MADHLAGRDFVTDSLVRELLGPAPAGRSLDIARPLVFEQKQDAYGPWTVDGSGEEVLDRDPPTRRYGVGVLFPASERAPEAPGVGGASATPADAGELGADGPLADQGLSEAALANLADIAERGGAARDDLDQEAEDFDLTAANDRRQSAIAVTFLARLDEAATFEITIAGGRYIPLDVAVAGRPRTWWARQPVSLSVEFDLSAMRATTHRALFSGRQREMSDPGPLKLAVSALSRPRGQGEWLVTAFVNNITPRSTGVELDQRALFQTDLRVRVVTSDGRGAVVSYPDRLDASAPNQSGEDASFELLYRHAKTFAIGHGCAGDWQADSDGERASLVVASMLPVVETASVTPDVYYPRDTRLRVSMAKLAGLDDSDDGSGSVEAMLDGYEHWISKLRPDEEPGHLVSVARDHVDKCTAMLTRMRAGLEFIRADPVAGRAFKLANEAVLQQQLRSRRQPRRIEVGRSGYEFGEPIDVPDWTTIDKRGYWWPFQLGFLLATVRSIALATDDDRSRVDLVFFPTGGGKTEAYLGQTAFSIFYRRIKNPEDAGVQVLMRYTLRLLTTQQFQRASALIAAMDLIRQRETDLGEEISIGIWLGGSMTPNRRADALAALRALRSERRAKNPLLVRRCPWCAAQMGPLRSRPGTKADPPGYAAEEGTIRFKCPDRRCPFSSGLPIYVIDEDIYEFRPSLVIGTVDKFALVAWRDDIRTLFGIGPTGARLSSPPSLIIQDELHLISGPLGSLSGLYETLIEELCTDRRGGNCIPPKIVASTATIRRLEAQVHALYARREVGLFPPHGLKASDNFFAKYAATDDGRLLPGRRYIGVHAPALGSVQTAQVRTFSALLQASEQLPDAEARDPWHTLMAFFNSLRELANSLTLLQSDIPDYLRVLQLRGGFASRRFLNQVKELTSRLTDDEVPAAIEDLEKPAGTSRAVDVCLASSIIEVGVDIDRLSLITLVGQPKSTAQYIQVTGRIGRQWNERPGLVVMVYSSTKPRDRSHFERFRSYHEKLYASVEPTSLTPFAPPVLERALHAILVGYVRQLTAKGTPPWPKPMKVNEAAEIARERVMAVDPDEAATLEKWLIRRMSEWDRYQASVWDVWRWADGQPDDPLIRGAGEWAPESARVRSWPTLRSMRNVDANCRLKITSKYAVEDAESAV